MAERKIRPDVKEIKNAYDALFNSSASVSKIKDAVLGGRLLVAPESGAGVAGRSLVWKLFLVEAGPLSQQESEQAAVPLSAIKSSRDEYQKLFLEKMRAPDGGYEDGLTIPGTNISPPRTERSGGNLNLNNPLSLHDENPWTHWFASMELRKTILQDVERTFPDMDYFRDPDVQTQLTNILFIYSVTHPDIGYRQGMHELLAPLYYAVDYDSVAEDERSPESEALREVCSRPWVGADAWMLFVSVMRGVGRWYEWRETRDPSIGKTPLASHVHLSANQGDAPIKPYVAPIVEACNRMQAVLLQSVDPQLWKSLQSAGIEPQIYGIRWLRLLFTREFSIDDAMVLWDGLFACDPSFELAPWICVAMLIRIRNQLIPADYSTQLTYLLRYPALVPSTSVPIHPATLLLRQALTLQMSPTASTGVSVIHENHTLLNIPLEVPEPPPPPMRRGRPRHGERGLSASVSHIGGSKSPSEDGVKTHVRQGSTPMGLPEMIARGLLERGESLGINKTVMNAVSELKRNLPDIASSLPRLPMSPPATSFTSYPLVDERPPAERPPWEPRTRFEVEREVADIRNVQRRLGDSVSWIVDTLLLDEDGTDAERAKSVRARKREALECLSYVRDVLKGTVSEKAIEEDRLVGEEELKRRRAQAEKEAAAAATAAEHVPTTSSFGLALPQPVAAASPAHQTHPTASLRRSQDYFTIQPSLSRTPPVKASPAPVAQAGRARAPSPTPTVSVLTPNSNGVPLAPWNHSRSAFSAPREIPATPLSRMPAMPRMPSKPSAVASALPGGGPRLSNYASSPPSQTPPDDKRVQSPPSAPQDPLGVLR